MKYAVFLLALLLCTGQSLWAQTSTEMPVTFRNSTPLSKTYTLTVGVDSRATACLDKELNEVDLPPPPPDFFPVILPGCTDPESETVITLHRDYRPISSTQFSYAYNVKLIRGPDREDVVIGWNKALAANVDSAFLQIEFLDTIDMASQDQFIITNDFISSLQIRVYYSFPTVSVGEEPLAKPDLFPQPVEEMLMLSTGEYKGGRYAVYTANGQRVLAGAVSDQPQIVLNINWLPAGVYLLHTETASGKSSYQSFVKK